MFNNVHEKLKVLAGVTFGIFIVLFGILTVFLFISGEVFRALIYLAVGVVSALSNVYMLYGLGQALENTEHMKYSELQTAAKLSEISAKLSKQSSDIAENQEAVRRILYGGGAAPAENGENAAKKDFPPAQNQPPRVNGELARVHPDLSPDGSAICCPVCKKYQRPDRTVCWNCGAEFI